MGPRQSSSGARWQSHDWSPDSQREWNDGGIGGGMDRPHHMSGDDSRFDRRESHSGEWETDQGRASYDYDPSRNLGSPGQYPRDEPYGRGDYGRGFGNRGDYRAQFGLQSDWRDQGRFGSGEFGAGHYGQQRHDQDRHSGPGNYRQGHAGAQFGQTDYARQHEYGVRGRSVGSGGHAGRGPKGYQRSDERIREDVSDSLTDDPDVDASEITVETRGGEVTLTGTVQTREEKRAAEACAEECSGVREVINQLRVSRGSPSSESSTGSSSGTSGGRSQSGQSGKGGRSSSES
jgi:osmotically-inducible protein OsmY